MTAPTCKLCRTKPLSKCCNILWSYSQPRGPGIGVTGAHPAHGVQSSDLALGCHMPHFSPLGQTVPPVANKLPFTNVVSAMSSWASSIGKKEAQLSASGSYISACQLAGSHGSGPAPPAATIEPLCNVARENEARLWLMLATGRQPSGFAFSTAAVAVQVRHSQ